MRAVCGGARCLRLNLHMSRGGAGGSKVAWSLRASHHRCPSAPKPSVPKPTPAGARGAFLSGAGSSILALTAGRKGDVYGQAPTERCDAAVARAMAAAAALVGMDGRILITTPAAVGAYVMELDGDAAAALSGVCHVWTDT